MIIDRRLGYEQLSGRGYRGISSGGEGPCCEYIRNNTMGGISKRAATDDTSQQGRRAKLTKEKGILTNSDAFCIVHVNDIHTIIECWKRQGIINGPGG